MKIIFVCIVVVLLIPLTSAIIINQVFVDPVKTDSGGEAIELYNPTNNKIDITGWSIETATSVTDVLFPELYIKPNEYFLIADIDWNESKDNLNWRDADFYETITLKNKDSGISLRDSSGSIVDRIYWGNESNTGKSFRKIDGNTIMTEPYFFEKQIFVQLTVEDSAIDIPDEDDAPGIQIKPTAGEHREIKVLVNSQNVLFNGEQIEVKQVNGSYEALLNIPYYTLPGNYSLIVGDYAVNVEILPVEDFSIITPSLTLYSTREDSIVKLKNTGNTFIDLKLSIPSLISNKEIYPQISPNSITLLPGQEQEFAISIEAINADPGVYSGVLIFEVIV